MNTWLLRTATLVAAFGAGAGSTLALEGAAAHAAIEHTYTDRECFPLGAAANTTVTSFAANQVCGRYNAKHGLSGADACVPGDIETIDLQPRAAGEWTACSVFRRQATVVLSAPQ